MYWSLAKEEDLIYRCCLLLGFLLLKLLPIRWNWGWCQFQLSVCGQPTLPLQQPGFARVGGSKCEELLLKFLFLAAQYLFATLKIFTAESLDLLLPLPWKSAEAGDADILPWSFFPCPAWGVWRRACPGPGMLMDLRSSCCWWPQVCGSENAGFHSLGSSESQPKRSKLIVDFSP